MDGRIMDGRIMEEVSVVPKAQDRAITGKWFCPNDSVVIYQLRRQPTAAVRAAGEHLGFTPTDDALGYATGIGLKLITDHRSLFH
jgi:hypothetical protein